MNEYSFMFTSYDFNEVLNCDRNNYSFYQGGLRNLITDAISVCNLSAFPNEGLNMLEHRFIDQVSQQYFYSPKEVNLDKEFKVRVSDSLFSIPESFDIESNIINLLHYIRGQTSAYVHNAKVGKRWFRYGEGFLLLTLLAFDDNLNRNSHGDRKGFHIS